MHIFSTYRDPFTQYAMKIDRIWRMLVSQLFWRWRLGGFGSRSVLFPPLLIAGAKRIFIGQQTQIRDLARLEVIHRPWIGWDATLKIGNQVNIEQGVHIVCQCEVTIEDNVSITPYCSIIDTEHPHDPPNSGPKIGDRLPNKRSFVHIGSGSFIGTRAIIMPNVRIGKCCVIGAGSVVNHDIPDYSVVAGTPARILKTFDPNTRTWMKASEH